ncbi:hypothetical protein RB195_019512 [Necator americanus]|uniref:CNNM transmembrane domain-containing protein n=1 Tax=Necator americanus TaxID=51031 RepID=A0ABR1CG69_NECAM
MRGRLGKFAVLLVQFFLFLIQKLLGNDKVEIFGVRVNKEPAEVIRNTEVFFTVFGTNLPSDSYFLSTTDRCEDSDSSDILDKVIIRLRTDAVFKNAVRLHATQGVPFSDKHPAFQLCNKGSATLNKALLQVTAPRSDSIATTWIILLVCAITLIISAYCSGANFAYMRMSINDMALIMDNGDEPHKTHARKIFKYRKQSNWLICTMAVTNILVNTIFTIAVSWLLEEHKYGSVLKYIVPTIMIVLLAEILPQSVCNRSGLKLAAKTRHITLILFVVCAPVAWPLSKIIDWVLGREVREIFSEEKLKTLIKVQSKKMEVAAQGDILARIADFPKKTVQEMMTPMEDAFVLSDCNKLDLKLLVAILEKGYTRIPVYADKKKSNISAVLNVKDLATMTIDQNWTVRDVISRVDPVRSQMRFVLASQKGESVMQEMMKGEHHLCGVIRFAYTRYKVIGIITFEDVIEEVFGDIEDDSDKMWNSRRAGIHKDQQTLEWFRQTETERGNGLNVNAMLKLIQTIFAACPQFATLGYDILRMKELLNIQKLRFSEENEVVQSNERRVLIFFSGSISVHTRKKTIYRLDPSRADFRPYIFGTWLVRRLLKERLYSLSCLGEPLERRTRPNSAEVLCFTRVGYYEVSLPDILNGLRDGDTVGYDYTKQIKTARAEGNEDYLTHGGKPRRQHTDAESTQVSFSTHTTPNLSEERDHDPLYSKHVMPSVLRANLENLQAGGVTSPHASERTIDPPALPKSAGRELAQHPGTPPKEERHGLPVKQTKEKKAAKLKSSPTGEKKNKSHGNEEKKSHTGEKAAKFTKRTPKTIIDWELFPSLVGFWEDTVMDNIDDEYELLVE